MAISLGRGDTRLLIEECKLQGLLRNQAAYVLERPERAVARFFSRPPLAR